MCMVRVTFMIHQLFRMGSVGFRTLPGIRVRGQDVYIPGVRGQGDIHDLSAPQAGLCWSDYAGTPEIRVCGQDDA